MSLKVQDAMNDGAMRRYVINLVRQIIADRGLTPRPGWREAVAALGLPPVCFRELPDGTDGIRADRQIVISARLSCPERVEFTVFHEVLHILIDEDEDWEIGAQLRGFSGSLDERGRQRVLEQLCQAGAAEFVVPAEPFAALMGRHGWQISSLAEAVTVFGCSSIAAAFQFAHCYPDPCVVAICEDGVLPQPGDAGGSGSPPGCRCLHVAYSVSNFKNKYPMRRHVAVPRSHLIHQAWRDAAPASGTDIGFFRDNRTWKMDCEVACLKRRAYALFLTQGRITQTHNPSQQTFAW